MGLEIAAAVGLISAVGGTGYSAYKGNMAAKQSQKAEALRQQQMNLDSQMKQREIFRKTQLAQATARQRATQSGSQFGSGLQGGLAEIAQRGGEDTNYNFQSTNIGNSIFAANAAQTGFKSQAETGQGFASLGLNLLQSLPTLNRIGTEIAGPRQSSSFPQGAYRGPYISSIY